MAKQDLPFYSSANWGQWLLIGGPAAAGSGISLMLAPEAKAEIRTSTTSYIVNTVVRRRCSPHDAG